MEERAGVVSQLLPAIVDEVSIPFGVLVAVVVVGGGCRDFVWLGDLLAVIKCVLVIAAVRSRTLRGAFGKTAFIFFLALTVVASSGSMFLERPPEASLLDGQV